MIILNEKQIECVVGGVMARCVLDAKGSVATSVEYFKNKQAAIYACCNDAGGYGVQFIDNVYGVGDYDPSVAEIPHEFEYCVPKIKRNLIFMFDSISV